MMKITNNYHSTIILPPDVAIYRGQSIDYAGWDAIKDHPNIAWYVDNGHLQVEGSVYSDDKVDSDDDEKAKLIADLAELGVEVDGRTGVKRLRAMLDEKLAEAGE